MWKLASGTLAGWIVRNLLEMKLQKLSMAARAWRRRWGAMGWKEEKL
jgi:hypothetical protein